MSVVVRDPRDGTLRVFIKGLLRVSRREAKNASNRQKVKKREKRKRRGQREEDKKRGAEKMIVSWRRQSASLH
jgi:hypothetical protein